MATPPDSPPRRVAVLVNPMRTAMAEAFLEALREGGGDRTVDVIDVDAPEDMADRLEAAIAGEPTTVAAVGGDGTQHTVAKALAGTDHVLAVVPGGTVNLLGQILGITDAAGSAAAILGGATRTLDLGTVEDEPFLLFGGTGFDARVMHATDDGAKRFGRLGYFVTGWRTLRADRPRPVEVTVDGESLFSGRAMSVMVANVGQRASSEFMLLPDARPDDGRIDVAIQRCDTPVSIARAVAALARGRRPRSDDVLLGQGRSIEVRWGSEVWSQVDGDATHTGRTFRYGVLPGALRVCVAADSAG